MAKAAPQNELLAELDKRTVRYRKTWSPNIYEIQWPDKPAVLISLKFTETEYRFRISGSKWRTMGKQEFLERIAKAYGPRF